MLGTGAPHSLALFHRGWLLEAVAATVAALVIVALRPHRCRP